MFQPQRDRMRYHRSPASASTARAPPPRGRRARPSSPQVRSETRPGQRRRKAHAENGRAPEQERQPVPFEVEHTDAAVELRHAERNGPHRIREVREAALERERRLDQREVVDPERLGQPVESDESAAAVPAASAAAARAPDVARGDGPRLQRGREGAHPASQKNSAAAAAPASARRRGDRQRQAETVRRPGRLGIEEQPRRGSRERRSRPRRTPTAAPARPAAHATARRPARRRSRSCPASEDDGPVAAPDVAHAFDRTLSRERRIARGARRETSRARPSAGEGGASASSR